jgi:hypothetical protein
MEGFYRLLMMFIWDYVIYVTGLLAALPMLPFMRVESVMKPRSNPYMWKSFGFTYHKSGKRYLYLEAVQAIGSVVWIVLLVFLTVSKIGY